jgi:hypothetical protein
MTFLISAAIFVVVGAIGLFIVGRKQSPAASTPAAARPMTAANRMVFILVIGAAFVVVQVGWHAVDQTAIVWSSLLLGTGVAMATAALLLLLLPRWLRR